MASPRQCFDPIDWFPGIDPIALLLSFNKAVFRGLHTTFWSMWLKHQSTRCVLLPSADLPERPQ
jgi:hypothetical protein